MAMGNWRKVPAIGFATLAVAAFSGFFWYISFCIDISLITFLYVPETRWSSQMTAVDLPSRCQVMAALRL